MVALNVIYRCLKKIILQQLVAFQTEIQGSLTKLCAIKASRGHPSKVVKFPIMSPGAKILRSVRSCMVTLGYLLSLQISRCREMKLSTLLVICIISSASSLMHESVFSHKVGQFSMSRSRWLVSFVIDLGVYENFLTRLSQSIDNVSNLVDKVLDKYQSPPTKDYQTVFEGFKNEIAVIQDMHNDIVYSFNEYKLLREPRTRRKRGVFNFIGDIMGSLFGVLTGTDIEKIQRNINTLAQNQLDLAHAFQESISVLNVTRLEVKQNRQKINDIIDTMGDIEDTIINISYYLEQQLSTLERVVFLTAYVTRVIEEKKTRYN